MNDADTCAQIESKLNERVDGDHYDACPVVLDPDANCECPALEDAARGDAAETRQELRREMGSPW